MDYWGGGGGGGQRVCWPPSQIIGGGPGPPSSYAYALVSAHAWNWMKSWTIIALSVTFIIMIVLLEKVIPL